MLLLLKISHYLYLDYGNQLSKLEFHSTFEPLACPSGLCKDTIFGLPIRQVSGSTQKDWHHEIDVSIIRFGIRVIPNRHYVSDFNGNYFELLALNTKAYFCFPSMAFGNFFS
jgi:hypothetical protein